MKKNAAPEEVFLLTDEGMEVALGSGTFLSGRIIPEDIDSCMSGKLPNQPIIPPVVGLLSQPAKHILIHVGRLSQAAETRVNCILPGYLNNP